MCTSTAAILLLSLISVQADQLSDLKERQASLQSLRDHIRLSADPRADLHFSIQIDTIGAYWAVYDTFFVRVWHVVTWEVDQKTWNLTGTANIAQMHFTSKEKFLWTPEILQDVSQSYWWLQKWNQRALKNSGDVLLDFHGRSFFVYLKYPQVWAVPCSGLKETEDFPFHSTSCRVHLQNNPPLGLWSEKRSKMLCAPTAAGKQKYKHQSKCSQMLNEAMEVYQKKRNDGGMDYYNVTEVRGFVDTRGHDSVLTFSFDIKRVSLEHYKFWRDMSIVFSLLSLLLFFININRTERLVVTVFLVNILAIKLIYSDYTMFYQQLGRAHINLVHFIFTSSIQLILLLLWSVLARALWAKSDTNPPEILRKLLVDRFGNLLLLPTSAVWLMDVTRLYSVETSSGGVDLQMQQPAEEAAEQVQAPEQAPEQVPVPLETEENVGTQLKEVTEWQIFIIAVDRVLFLLMLITTLLSILITFK